VIFLGILIAFGVNYEFHISVAFSAGHCGIGKRSVEGSWTFWRRSSSDDVHGFGCFFFLTCCNTFLLVSIFFFSLMMHMKWMKLSLHVAHIWGIDF
jgi:hypothetical protein